MLNSHKGLTVSSEEAHICCQLDVEITKMEVKSNTILKGSLVNFKKCDSIIYC